MMTIALSKEHPEDYAYDREKTRALHGRLKRPKSTI
jgi:DNA-directed RNA polymerase subunit A"